MVNHGPFPVVQTPGVKLTTMMRTISTLLYPALALWCLLATIPAQANYADNPGAGGYGDSTALLQA